MQKKSWVFKHSPLEKLDIKRIDGEVRTYVTPEGDTYPSVTTALGYLSEKKMKAARENIGEAVFDDLSSRAVRNGRALHELAEKFLSNDDSWQRAMPIAMERFLKIKKIIQEHVDLVYGVEYPLYSNKLKVSGTADLICKYDNINTILDLKTSKDIKTEEQIIPYFLQCTAYAIMCEELYSMNFPQIVILMAVNEDEPLVFKKQTSEWKKLTEDYFRYYREGKLK